MPKITMTEYEERPTFPENSILMLKVEDCMVVERSTRDGRTWESLEFTFKILGVQTSGDGSPLENYDHWITQKIYGSCSFIFNDSPDNRLKQWAEAILGVEMGIGFDLDTDLLIGRKCRGVTGQYVNKNDKARHKITDLLPMGGLSTQPTAPQQFVASPVTQPQSAAGAAVAAQQQAQQAQQQTQPARVADPWGEGKWDQPPF